MLWFSALFSFIGLQLLANASGMFIFIAAGEYIDLMAATEMIDAEDVVELQQAPNAVNELDSFRFFFVAAFLMPAYQKVSREARKRIKDHLVDH